MCVIVKLVVALRELESQNYTFVVVFFTLLGVLTEQNKPTTTTTLCLKKPGTQYYAA